jgi:predicted N-acetyltransferase YhbS
MVTIRHEQAIDIAAREALLDKAFGESRFAKSSEGLRRGRLPADDLSFVAMKNGRLIGTVRLWHISAGPDRPALLLGPLAVDPAHRNCGLGAGLMERAIGDAKLLGHREILLVGDPAYYERFGFSAESTFGLSMPGPFERHRLLSLALVPALDAAPAGLIRATGLAAPRLAVPSNGGAQRRAKARKVAGLSHAA